MAKEGNIWVNIRKKVKNILLWYSGMSGLGP